MVCVTILAKIIDNYFFIPDATFFELLQHGFKVATNSKGICDIYDGQIYRERSTFYSNPWNISVTLNYDGAPKLSPLNAAMASADVCE